MSYRINTASGRDRLEPRREPYWGTPLDRGRSLGYRKIDQGRGTWIARSRDPETGKQHYQALKQVSASDFYAATAAAKAWFKMLDAGVTQNGPFTVAAACREYLQELERGGRAKAAADAAWRFRRGAVYGMKEGKEDYPELVKLGIGRIEVTRLRTPTLKSWRDLLGMSPAGQNRMTAVLRAALNLAIENNRVPASAPQARGAPSRGTATRTRPSARSTSTWHSARALLEAAQGNLRDLVEDRPPHRATGGGNS